MNYYAMDTDAVQSVGRGIYNLEPEAQAAVQGVLDSYTSAAGAVCHPVVCQALNSYHDTHQKGHLAVPQAVKALGANTANGGKVVADGSNESTNAQLSSLSDQQALLAHQQGRLAAQ